MTKWYEENKYELKIQETNLTMCNVRNIYNIYISNHINLHSAAVNDQRKIQDIENEEND